MNRGREDFTSPARGQVDARDDCEDDVIDPSAAAKPIN